MISPISSIDIKTKGEDETNTNEVEYKLDATSTPNERASSAISPNATHSARQSDADEPAAQPQSALSSPLQNVTNTETTIEIMVPSPEPKPLLEPSDSLAFVPVAHLLSQPTTLVKPATPTPAAVNVAPPLIEELATSVRRKAHVRLVESPHDEADSNIATPSATDAEYTPRTFTNTKYAQKRRPRPRKRRPSFEGSNSEEEVVAPPPATKRGKKKKEPVVVEKSATDASDDIAVHADGAPEDYMEVGSLLQSN